MTDMTLEDVLARRAELELNLAVYKQCPVSQFGIEHCERDIALCDLAAEALRGQGEPAAWLERIGSKVVDAVLTRTLNDRGNYEPLYTREERPRQPALGHDEAIVEIHQHIKAIEILCDAFGYDPCQWLIVDEAGLKDRT